MTKRNPFKNYDLQRNQQHLTSFFRSFCPQCHVKLKKVHGLEKTYECPRCGLRLTKQWSRQKV